MPVKPTTPLVVTEDEKTGNKFVAYKTAAGTEIDCQFDGENPWFTQKDLATIFGVEIPTVIEHIQKFLSDGELDEATVRNFRVVRQEGSRSVERQIQHYNLDVAFYVGYRVNSTEGKLFRRWATTMLVQLVTKGFVVNKRQLRGNADRIRELREIIRDLRSDEANIYAELRHICSLCRDYDPKDDGARQFYQRMQARIFYAVTSHTPAQLIESRADAEAENMGLNTWSGDRVMSKDVGTGKNYLADGELKELNRLVTIVLDVFEDQLDVGNIATMADCEKLLVDQLRQLRRPILGRVGPPSSEDAVLHAKQQYKLFDQRRKALLAEQAQSELEALRKQTRDLPRIAKPGRDSRRKK